jgi:two-component system sensor histidine kinase UhpB
MARFPDFGAVFSRKCRENFLIFRGARQVCYLGAMALRTRVVLLIGLVLLTGVLAGSLFAGFQARRGLAEELNAGMAGARQTVAGAYEDLGRSDHPARDLRQLTATFDGNRHVRATLIALDGSVSATSSVTRPKAPAPGWFASLLGPAPAEARLPVPLGVKGFSAIVLDPTPALDVSALWTEFSGVVLLLISSSMIGLALVYVAIGAALRPLRDMSEGFLRIGAGDYRGRVTEQGPSELRRLEQGFNAMSERLAAMDDRNRTLETQLVTLQDEERADLARDLHDEIGPHLFAVNVDAQEISQLADGRKPDEIRGHVKSIQSNVGHMQRLVREILQRLRPTRATELGLNAALADLAAFWQTRRPGMEIDLSVPKDERELDETVKDVIYRVAQEGLANAVRHADAQHVAITVALLSGEAVVRVKDDGAGDPLEPREAGGGLGLIGMRERVRGCGGALDIDRDAGGWEIVARLPLNGAITMTQDAAESAA